MIGQNLIGQIGQIHFKNAPKCVFSTAFFPKIAFFVEVF